MNAKIANLERLEKYIKLYIIVLKPTALTSQNSNEQGTNIFKLVSLEYIRLFSCRVGLVRLIYSQKGAEV